jgi:serine/threonine protein kinase
MSIRERSKQYGMLFGAWQTGQLLGDGSKGQSAVYEVHRFENGRQEIAALKAVNLIRRSGAFESLSAQCAEDYLKTLRLLQRSAVDEVRVMAKLWGNTNIVDYLDFDTHEWTEQDEYGCDLLILMERLSCLRNAMNGGRIFTEEEILKIGKDICAALTTCHEKRILHRDIKPENIFFDCDGTYKLGDFGISKIMDTSPDALASTSIGTPTYSSPEQVLGRYDQRADIYSLGIVLYELSNGNRLPFARRSFAQQDEIELRLSSDLLPAPCDARADLAKIILKACAKKPADRYQTAAEFREALEQLEESRISVALIHHTSGIRQPSTMDSRHVSYDTIPANQEWEEMSEIQESDANCAERADFERLLKAARQGDADAQNAVGVRYHKGVGVKEDPFQAVFWYRKAAAQNHPSGQYNLGECYLSGNAVKKDNKKASCGRVKLLLREVLCFARHGKGLYQYIFNYTP